MRNQKKSSGPNWLLWGAIAVGFLWCALFIVQPLWPSDVAPPDSEVNGPRWLLLLVPDQTVAHWFDGPVTIAGLGRRGGVLAVAVGLVGWATLAGFPVVSAWPPIPAMTRIEKLALATAWGLATQSLVALIVGLAGGVGSLASGPLILSVTLVIGIGVGWLGRRRSPNATYFAIFVSGKALASGLRGCLMAGQGPRLAPSAHKVDGMERSAPGKARSESMRPQAKAASLALSEADASPAWASHLPALFFALLACLLLARSMMPPAEYDVREYHLQAPKEWSQTGRIEFMPHNIYANMPMGVEMQTLLAMDCWRWFDEESEAWWWGALSGKLAIAGYAILTGILCGQLVRRLGSPLAGRWTCVFVLSMPALFEGASLGLIEAGVACFFAAGLLVVAGIWPASRGEHSGADGNGDAIAWLGFWAGAAMACKYPALLFVALPLGLAHALLAARQPWQVQLKRSGLFAVLLLLGCGPWYLKNAVWAGNPVYPLASSVFGGETMTPAKIAQWQAGHRSDAFGPQAVVHSLKRLSWSWKNQSMILFPLALVGVMGSWRCQRTRWILVALALTLALWWLFTHRIERFLVPSLPLMFALAGLGWGVIRLRFGLHTATCVAVVGVGMDLLLVASPIMGDSRLAVDLSRLRVDRPVGEAVSRLPEHVRYVNARLEADDRLLLVGDAAAFDYEVPVDYSTTFDESPLARILTLQPPGRWGDALRRNGYTHVLVHWGEIARLRSSYGFDRRIRRERLAEMEAAGALQIVQRGLNDGRVDLYRVPGQPVPAEPVPAAGR